MKFLGLLSSIFLSSQILLANDPHAIMLSEEGNFGIGIESPVHKLHLSGGDAYLEEKLGIGTEPEENTQLKIKPSLGYDTALRVERLGLTSGQSSSIFHFGDESSSYFKMHQDTALKLRSGTQGIYHFYVDSNSVNPAILQTTSQRALQFHMQTVGTEPGDVSTSLYGVDGFVRSKTKGLTYMKLVGGKFQADNQVAPGASIKGYLSSTIGGHFIATNSSQETQKNAGSIDAGRFEYNNGGNGKGLADEVYVMNVKANFGDTSAYKFAMVNINKPDINTGFVNDAYGIYLSEVEFGNNNKYQIYSEGGTTFLDSTQPDQTMLQVRGFPNHTANLIEVIGGNDQNVTVIDPSGFIGINTDTPQGSIDLQNANAPFILPHIADPSSVSSPINGMMIYNTTAAKVQVYENGSWLNISN